MARRRAIEADELFETANRMKAEGKDVTAVGLLDALGGGSLRTIYKHLEVWQATRPTEVKNEVTEIPSAVQAGFANAWRLAAQEAGREVEEVKAKAKEEVSAALRQFHGAVEQIGKLEAESEADGQTIEKLTERTAELEGQLHAVQSELATDKALLEQLQKQLEAQAKELAELRAGKEAAIKEAAELSGRVSSLQEQNDKLLDGLTRPKKDAAAGGK